MCAHAAGCYERISYYYSNFYRTLINDIKWRMFTALVPAMPDDIRQRFVEFEAVKELLFFILN